MERKAGGAFYKGYAVCQSSWDCTAF